MDKDDDDDIIECETCHLKSNFYDDNSYECQMCDGYFCIECGCWDQKQNPTVQYIEPVRFVPTCLCLRCHTKLERMGHVCKACAGLIYPEYKLASEELPFKSL